MQPIGSPEFRANAAVPTSSTESMKPLSLLHTDTGDADTTDVDLSSTLRAQRAQIHGKHGVASRGGPNARHMVEAIKHERENPKLRGVGSM